MVLLFLASSIGIARFNNQDPEDYFVLVGVAKDMKLSPRQVDGGFVYTFKYVFIILTCDKFRL